MNIIIFKIEIRNYISDNNCEISFIDEQQWIENI